MDSISCEINFKIVTKPEEPYTELALSQVDGNLNIRNAGVLIFNEDDICLAEFAAKLSAWLCEGYPRELFIYESMDYEEPYIIMLEAFDGDGAYLSSPWMNDGISSPLVIRLGDFIIAARLFLNKFEEELSNISSIYCYKVRD
ncbi:DUF7878 domain-containing protein [Pseudoalteromonas aurantia]|uniref:DUF7878 domain-containing protein n=1 Tax=Pseudoalteromonas aurantia 208 TaxID=1314867 RepID=A0ABR9E7R8_9GAMM|nr:hypothetical protein [Pseudoalteromonas aurantia]MBE0367046.1 hypothetical protein [Pseudoalteromonas aurantia 208]